MNPCASSVNINEAVDFSGETTTKKWGPLRVDLWVIMPESRRSKNPS